LLVINVIIIIIIISIISIIIIIISIISIIMVSCSQRKSQTGTSQHHPMHVRNHHQSGTLSLPAEQPKLHCKTATFAAAYSLVLQRGHEDGSRRARQLCTQPCAARHQRRERREQRAVCSAFALARTFMQSAW
jgi:hypothetical protein